MKHCSQCGKCCSGLSLGTATANDLERWEDDPQMIPWVDAGYLMDGVVDLFISPKTGEDFDGGRCPFLRKVRNEDKFYCKIHDKKPDVCRNYICDEMKEISSPLK